MQNGRWNRGALVQWLTRYVSQNGGRVVSVNPANASQKCHSCGAKVSHPTREVSACAEHGIMGRDVGAASNIAARAAPRAAKARVTRAKARYFRENFQHQMSHRLIEDNQFIGVEALAVRLSQVGE